MKKLTEINFNDYVWVILTPEGEKMWADHWIPSHPGGVPDSVRHVDRDGRTQFQLHALMHIFGPGCVMGSNDRHPFSQNRIWFEHD